MIIIVAGSNGAGKSTAVEAVLKVAVRCTMTGEGKARGYDVVLEGVPRMVRVVGPYFTGRTTCGCDALNDVAGSHALVRAAHDAGQHVIFEGMKMMGHQDSIDHYKYAKGDMHVVALASDEETCARSVLARRALKGDNNPIDAKNKKTIRDNITRARNLASKLAALGCPRTRVDRTLAPETIIRILREAR